MRKLLALTIMLNLFISILPPLSSHAEGQVNPWPRAKVLPFPWDSIEGTWTDPNTRYTLSFTTVENSWGNRHIKIKQIDSSSGRVLAQGLGYENSDDIVRAGMSGGQSQYLLTIRQLTHIYCGDKRSVTGVTMETYDHHLITHFEIYKSREIPLTPILLQDYNQPYSSEEQFEPACWDN